MLRRPIWSLEVRHEVDLRPGAAIDRAEESARNLDNNHDGAEVNLQTQSWCQSHASKASESVDSQTVKMQHHTLIMLMQKFVTSASFSG
jgi:hypothetical protein